MRDRASERWSSGSSSGKALFGDLDVLARERAERPGLLATLAGDGLGFEISVDLRHAAAKSNRHARGERSRPHALVGDSRSAADRWPPTVHRGHALATREPDHRDVRSR